MNTPTHMHSSGTGRSAFGYMASCLLGLLVSGLAYGAYAWRYLEQEQHLFRGKPLLSSYDAYYYLRETRELVQGAAGLYDVSALSWLAAVPVALGVDLMWTAFWLPAVLGSLMAAVYAAFGVILQRPGAGLVAAAAGAASSYWYIKTTPGSFDTDCLNPFFLCAAAFGTWAFTELSGRHRLAGLAVALGAGAGLLFWWPQTGFIALVCSAATYCASAVFAGPLRERAVKWALLAAGGGAAVIAVSGLGQNLPGLPGDLIASIHDHINVVLRRQTSVFPVVSETVSELGDLSFMDAARYVAGSVAAFCIGAAGCLWMALKQPRFVLHLAPLAVLGLMGFTTARLLVFLTPIYAMGLGYGLADGAALAARKLDGRVRIKQGLLQPALLTALGLACVVPALAYSLELLPGAPMKRAQAAMAQAVREKSPEDAVVWSWWSFGHGLRYFSDRQTLVTGATLDSRRIFIAAVPLAANDPDFAANWMRFFARHPIDKLQHVQNMTGGEANAVEFLRRLFADRKAAAAVMESHGVAATAENLDYFFPQHSVVYVYLDPQIFNEVATWFSFSSWDFAAGHGVEPYFRRLGGDEVVIKPREGHLIKPETGLMYLKRIVLVDTDGKKVITYEDRESERTVLAARGSNQYYVFRDDVYDTLFMRLLVRHPDSTPRFSLVEHNPLQGGWWRVEPSQP